LQRCANTRATRSRWKRVLEKQRLQNWQNWTFRPGTGQHLV